MCRALDRSGRAIANKAAELLVFKLVGLEGGGTRLIGRTWHTLNMRPHAYWTIWADWIVHRIHARVLRHIKRLAEANL